MADLIKKIKIKKQDGTFTDYIPIGADAINVETSDSESVELKLNKKPYYYNTIADMKADTKLKAGDMAITLGYYEANDGGNGEYKIVNNSQLVDDGGSIHDLSNGLKAELINKRFMTPEQFGAKGDGITDDSNVFTYIASYIENNLNGKGVLNLIGEKSYKIKITIPYININGNNAILTNDFENSSNYVIKFTSSNTRGQVIRDLRINCKGNSTTKGFNGLYCENLREQKFENIYIENINEYGINADSGFGGAFNNCYIQGVINSTNESYTPYGTGFYLKTSDCIINNLTVVNTHIGLEDRGLNIVDGLHIWIAASEYAIKENSIGVYKKNSGLYNNIYIDSLQYGFYIEDNLNLKVNNIHWLIKNTDFTSYLIYNNSNVSLRGVNISNINLNNTVATTNFKTFNKGSISVSNLFSIANNESAFAFPDISVTLNNSLSESRKQINILNDMVFISIKCTATANISANSSLLSFTDQVFSRGKYHICYINKQPVEFYIGNQIYNSFDAINQNDEVIIDLVIPKI